MNTTDRREVSSRPMDREGETEPVPSLQDRVRPWLLACFGEAIAGDRLERADRLLEEVFELLQSGGYDPSRVLSLRDYVWSRPAGEPAQEVGGVMITLAAYCLAHGLDMHAAGETELARIWTKVEKIRAKQAAKPTGSALPQVWPEAKEPDIAGAATVLLSALEHAQIDSAVLRRFYNGEPRAALQMLAGETDPSADRAG